jgi:uncharacterized protein
LPGTPTCPVDELEKRLNAAFKAVPYTSGINNHMGSRMTSQPKRHGVVDGRFAASAQVLCRQPHQRANGSRRRGTKDRPGHVSRDVFLDDVRTEQAITTQLQTAIKLAHKQGSAVMIGHPYPQTLAVLERELPKLKAQGIDWIDIRQMIGVRSNKAMAGHGKDGVYR